MVMTPCNDMRTVVRTTTDDPELRMIFTRRYGDCSPERISLFFYRCRLAEISATLYDEPEKPERILPYLPIYLEGGKRISLTKLGDLLDRIDTAATARDKTRFLRDEDDSCLAELIRICADRDTSAWK